MKFYNSIGPNPQVVRMFAHEHGITLDTVPVSEDLNGNGIQNDNADPDADEIDRNGTPGIFENLGSRITLFGGLTGRESITRTIITDKNLSTQNVFWSRNQKFDLALFPVERVRVESQDRRFTWMLTVRQSPVSVTSRPEASVDLVVFSNRSFSPLDERVYPPPNVALTFPTPTPPLPVRTSAFEANRPDSNLVYVAYDPAIADSKPFVKKGGYVLDVMNAIWYRIQDFRENPPGTNTGTIEIQIDRPAIANSLSVSVNSSPPSAIFMQGIVEVFPLGSK